MHLPRAWERFTEAIARMVARDRSDAAGATAKTTMMRLTTTMALLGLVGCRPSAPGASYAQLHQRASFDLRCSELSLRHLDARTKIVSGCGAELVYVEECQRIRGTESCAWRLESAPLAVSAPQAAPAPRTYAAALPRRARLLVRAVGGSCRVTVNGLRFGTTPISATPPFTGPLRVACETEDGEKLVRDVQLDEGATARVLFTVGPVDLGY